MNVEALYTRYLALTSNPQAAASLVLAEAMAGSQLPPEPIRRPETRITVAEASERFGVPKRTLQTACRNGKLQHSRTGRVIRLKPRDLELFLSGVETQSDWRLGS